jgi:hypothetical protein
MRERFPMSLVYIEPTTPAHSQWDALIGIAIILLAMAALWLLNRLIGHFFPSTKKLRTAGGNALMRFEATFLPGREHILEAIERDDEEADEQGDPPHTGTSDGPLTS